MLKYYKNMVLYRENINYGVGVITGWMDKNIVYDKLTDKDKVIACGNLYTPKGINYLVRNLYLNSNINKLLVIENDKLDDAMQKSIKTFKDFLNNGEDSFLDENITSEAVSFFRQHFKDNTTFTSFNKVNDCLADLTINKNNWTLKQEFKEEKIHSTTLPSEKMVFSIKADTVSEAWPRIIKTINDYGTVKNSSFDEDQKELLDLFVLVKNEDINDIDFGDYFSYSKEEIDEYANSLLKSDIPEGLDYTYGARLNDYKPGHISQLDYIVKTLKKEPHSRRAVACLWSPSLDTKSDEVPCFNMLSFNIDDNKLFLTAIFRSNDMFNAWPKNTYGLLKIQDIICEKLGVEKGYLLTNSISAHIYERNFKEVEDYLKEKEVSFCNEDDRGYVIFDKSDLGIKATLCDKSDNKLKEVEGDSTSIRSTLANSTSNFDHAYYLGSEATKADIVRQLNTKYTQDENIEKLVKRIKRNS